jgi:dTMP kinase
VAIRSRSKKNAVAQAPSPAPKSEAAKPAVSVEKKYIGRGLPYTDLEDLSGHLIVIEGSDGVGRTTQIGLLRDWLQVQGFGVVETGWRRSRLVGQTIDLAKEGHAMNLLTHNLLYATDFADRLEHDIIPALRAGFVVLSDRYIYTAYARAAARRADTPWVRSLYGFAIVPDLVVYLKVDVKTLFDRVIRSSGLDYWEAGLDQNPGCDPYESFRRYQSKLLDEFDNLSKEFGFREVDARRAVKDVQRELRKHIAELLTIPAAGAD